MAKRNRNRRQIAPTQTGQQSGQVITAQAVFSGPLPPSVELENYERILPGLAHRIVSQFELEGTHRRDMERRYLNLQGSGLAIGSVLYVIWIFASFVMIMTGHGVEGAVSGFIAITALMTNTIVGYRRRQK